MSNMALVAGAGAGLIGMYCLLKRGGGGSAAAAAESDMKDKLYRLLPQEGSAEHKVMTLAELKAHDFPEEEEAMTSDKRSWIMIYDVIFDVTDYMEWHPGGGSVLVDWVDKLADYAKSEGAAEYPDSREDFEAFHGENTLAEVAGKMPGDTPAPIYKGHFRK